MTHSSGSCGAASGTSGFIGLQQSKKVVNKLLQNQNQVIQIQRANWNKHNKLKQHHYNNMWMI
ncbi:hypothetical protein [Spiroplasma endosymbiont of Virgichneumon dumeticola]|uniref:hypothetical protein n=1 Tax=Spiroplasma endosymbiont of Virgichneumon dumeticola TaxID=3139323 RepID=UPI0035C920CD